MSPRNVQQLHWGQKRVRVLALPRRAVLRLPRPQQSNRIMLCCKAFGHSPLSGMRTLHSAQSERRIVLKSLMLLICRGRCRAFIAKEVPGLRHPTLTRIIPTESLGHQAVSALPGTTAQQELRFRARAQSTRDTASHARHGNASLDIASLDIT